MRDQSLGLAFRHVEIVENDQRTVLGLRRQGHLQAERTNLLVEVVAEGAGTSTVRLTTTDEHGRLAIAVTSRTAAFLATELLAGAGNVRTLAGSARRGAALFELPKDDAVQDVGAGLDAEDGIVQFHVTSGLRVEGLYIDLHD